MKIMYFPMEDEIHLELYKFLGSCVGEKSNEKYFKVEIKGNEINMKNRRLDARSKHQRWP